MINYELISADLDQTSGFAWVQININGIEYTIQACLKLDKRYQETDCIYTKSIVENDSGFDDGICADVNAPIVSLFEYDYQTAFYILKTELKKIGVRFI